MYKRQLQYLEFVHLMSMATIVLTDSGGIQEEAPGLGKPDVYKRQDLTMRRHSNTLGLPVRYDDCKVL